MSRYHQVLLRPSGRCFDVRPDETILAAATRHAVWLPSRCRSGSCGQCVGRRLAGEISHVVRPVVTLELDQVCLCIAKARSDVEIDVQDHPEPERRLRRLPATVVTVADGTCPVMMLQLPSIIQTALVEGDRFDLRAPAAQAGMLTILSVRSDRMVLVRWEARASTCLTRMPTFRANDVLQVELLI